MSSNQPDVETTVTDSKTKIGITTSEEPGTGPIKRAVFSRLQVAVVLEGRGDRGNIDTAAIDNEINNELTISFDVRTRDARINGDAEVLLVSRASVLGEETVEDAVEITRRQLINQGVGFQVLEWRIEAI